MSLNPAFPSLGSGFARSLELYPARTALVVNGETVTYSDLARTAGKIALIILQHSPEADPLAAVFAYRSRTAYAGVLGALAAGKGYVPLNPRFPVERTRKMLASSGCSTLVVGNECVCDLAELLAPIDGRLTVLLPDVADVGGLASQLPQHRLVASAAVAETPALPFRTQVDGTAPAYLLFTSGSTGEPKGVAISHRNVRAYVEYASAHYGVSELDRFSQAFDMTFDLSVHDMFVCWEGGASLYCVPENSLVAPAKFIRDHHLTMWFSVPSVIGLLSRLRLLRAASFPSLRYSLFCGEALSAAYAQLWQDAAPQSIVENLYGPTEATIAITVYRWDNARSPGECLNGIVPIGAPFPGQRAAIIDADGRWVPDGSSGELCLSGSQVTSGYWHDPVKTQQQFVRLPGDSGAVWYRTGDFAKRDSKGCLHYLGRIDQQVKIRGYRVELQEIEAVLRNVCGTESVAAVAWPVRNGSAESVVAFVAGPGILNEAQVLSCCRKVLPDYAIPARLFPITELPLNGNGKIDRSRLIHLLEGAQDENIVPR